MSSWSTCQVLQPPAFRKYNIHWAFEELCICICVRHCHRQLIPDIIPRQQNTRKKTISETIQNFHKYLHDSLRNMMQYTKQIQFCFGAEILSHQSY